ncbi:transcriptional regulator [Vibrio ostreicida]|uniref:Winged helix-turn-helix domain-containing protein n=1 Tax=Vibrio ostreicida TaxID=526588 RepID=A0ABT8C0Z1_9VIBR|nr:winged helix-turn-helix domain-containing protein [Vibrio ostreicida]MDN3612008.1 winged helix-turn-helix domain-containing protein [Vibrio ostreicida]NPD08818.1 hypothetical protein [Vibrio ostreicida]
MTRSFKVRQFVLVENSLFILDSKTNQQLRMGTHDLLTLHELCAHAGQVVSKESLLEKGWPGKIVSDSSLTQSIRNIRTLLGDNGKEQKWLKTVAKVGYVLDASIVSEVNGDALPNSAMRKNVTQMLSTTSENTDAPQRSPLYQLLNCTRDFHCALKLVILFALLAFTVNVSYKIYHLVLNKQRATQYPEVSYTKGVIEIYSDRQQVADQAGEAMSALIDKLTVKPKRVAVMLLNKNLSFAIVAKDGEILNKLILLDKTIENDQIAKLMIKEVSDAIR